ncbi:CC/Se motif family (seleno)protein [Acetobacterium sp.]|uniref:CC/Se motif family (seleno)protein n=1 Tax=Acetobacterium sp. TaxID=1872094 RepID=UPI002F41A468
MNKSYKMEIDQPVLDYMKRKRKNVLTLEISSTGGGCCPTFEISEVNLITPDKTELFNVYRQNDITLYISKNAKVIAQTLHFTLKKNLFGTTILVDGIFLKKRS